MPVILAGIAAATSLTLTSGSVGAASVATPRCTTAGLTVIQNLSGTTVASVTVGNLPAACGGAILQATVNNGTTIGSGSATVPGAGGSLTISAGRRSAGHRLGADGPHPHRPVRRALGVVAWALAAILLAGRPQVGSAASLNLSSQLLTPYRTCTISATPATTTAVADANVRQGSATTNFGAVTTVNV